MDNSEHLIHALFFRTDFTCCRRPGSNRARLWETACFDTLKLIKVPALFAPRVLALWGQVDAIIFVRYGTRLERNVQFMFEVEYFK